MRESLSISVPEGDFHIITECKLMEKDKTFMLIQDFVKNRESSQNYIELTYSEARAFAKMMLSCLADLEKEPTNVTTSE